LHRHLIDPVNRNERAPLASVFSGEGMGVRLTIRAKRLPLKPSEHGPQGTGALDRLFRWRRRIVDWASDSRLELANVANAARDLGSLANRRNALLLVLSALPLILALGLLPVPPGSSWPRLAERAAWQWTLLQNTPESYAWFYRNWASEAGRPVIAERIDDAAWARAASANAYEDYVAYITAYSRGGRHIVAAVNAADDLLWAQVDSMGTPSSYSIYLEKFPRGRHAEAARDNLEETAWRQLAGDLTIDGLTDFINEFPAGRHIEEARNALEKLQQETADATPPTDPSQQAASPFPAPPAPAGTVTGSLGGSTHGMPKATNVALTPVPLPRPRPHFVAIADADEDVPLPRPRPKTLGPAGPQTALNPLGWLQGLFKPHQ
jgi:hypothetical protein